jgi:PAS domain S-box-containing protein
MLCLLLATPLFAHNGAVALAYPVEKLTIDADLSDWPEHIPEYPVRLPEYGAAPLSTADLQAWVRLAYSVSEQVLYVAMEVVDDVAVVAGSSSAAWDTEDGAEIYLDLTHGESSAVRQYTIRGAGTAAQRAADDTDEVLVRWRRQSGRQIYEWRIDISGFALHDMAAGNTLSADFVVCDYDPDGSFSWLSWGRKIYKVGPADRRGDVVLVRDPERVGHLEGSVLWSGTDVGIAGSNVRLQSTADSSLSVRLTSRSGGLFDVDLPAGEYVADVELGAQSLRQTLHLSAAEVTRIQFDVEPTGGRGVDLGPGRSLRSGTGARQGAWQTMGVIDGVQGGLTTSIQQDAEGLLWFGTQAGLHSFDGALIRHYDEEDGLLHNRVTCLWTDPDGALWIGTEGGLSQMVGQRLTHFTTRDGLIDNQVAALLRDTSGDLWIATDGGLSRFDGDRFINYTVADGLGSNSVWSLAEQNASIWIGSRGGGLSLWDGTTFQVLHDSDGLAGNYTRSLLVDTDGILWIGTENGLSRFDGTSFRTFGTQEGLVFPAVNALAQDARGDLWVSACESLFLPGAPITCQPGRLTGGEFEFWSDLGTEFVFDLHVDQEGNIWSAITSGLARYDAGDFVTLTTQEGLGSNTVRSLIEDSHGNIWMGTMGGASVFDGDTIRTISTDQGLPHNTVHDLLEDTHGQLWIATEGGLASWDGANLTAYTTANGLPYDRILQLAQAADGELWMASMGGGVLRYRDGAFSAIDASDGLANNSVLSVRAHPESGVWATIWDAGVTHVEDAGQQQYTTTEGLQQNGVSSIYVDRDGLLWLATQGAGISVFDDSTFHHLDPAEGMVQDVVSIAQGSDGSYWFSSSTGISRFDGFAFQSLLERDGLAENSVMDLLEDGHGNIWIATLGGGVTRYRPSNSPPPVAVTDVITETRLGPVDAVRLPSTGALLAFEFHGISYRTRPGAMLYRYRLAGHDEDWQATAQSRVEYSRLPAGEYSFQVQAIDRDLVYSTEPASVDVVVHLPWGQYGQLLVLALAVIGLVWQTKRIVQRNQRLSMAHTQLSESLTEAQSSRQLAEAEIGVREQREREQRVLGEVRDAVWTLSSSTDLQKVMPAFRQALLEARVPFTNSGINLVEGGGDAPRMTIALFNAEGQLVTEQVEDSDNVALKLWQSQETAYRRDLDAEDPHGERGFIAQPTRCVLDVPFSHGTLAVSSPRPSNFDDHVAFMEQLAAVLSEGFRRADDLRLLEERTLHLQQEEHRQRTILQTANEGFWLVDPEMVTVQVNAAMCDILGRKQDEIVGQPLWAFFDEQNQALMRFEIARRKEGVTGAFEVSIVQPDDTSIACLFSHTPLLDRNGHISGSFSMVTDIRERREREHHQALLTRLRQSVWQLDSTSGVVDLLRPLRNLLEDSAVPFRVFGVNIIESAEDVRVRAYTTGEAEFSSILLAPVHGSKVIEFWQQGEIVNRTDLHNDDSMSELQTWDGARQGPRSIIDIPFSQGTLAANSPQVDAFTQHLVLLREVAGILDEGFRRLDDLQALRDRTARAEAANRSKSVFLANMSHEIRTPMNAILGFTEILQRSLTDPRQLGYIESMQSSGQSLLSLINDILDLSKVESGDFDLEYRVADAHAVLRDLERLFGNAAAEKGIDLAIDIDESFPGVLVIDEIRLRQILVNLTSNAVKFTEQGGVVVRAQATVNATAAAADAVDLTFAISDSGVGIPKDQQERIFGSFEQRDGQSINEYSGTGLGLALTRQLVTLMHGEVLLSSELGKGSTFTVLLPDVTVGDVAGLQHAGPENVDVKQLRFEPATTLGAEARDGATIQLSDAQRARLPELFESLDARRDELAQMAAAPTINDVEELAQELLRLGEEYRYAPVIDWAQNLAGQAATFDMAGLADSLTALPQLLTVLSRELP